MPINWKFWQRRRNPDIQEEEEDVAENLEIQDNQPDEEERRPWEPELVGDNVTELLRSINEEDDPVSVDDQPHEDPVAEEIPVAMDPPEPEEEAIEPQLDEEGAEMVQNQQGQTPEELLEQGLMVRPNLTDGPAFTLFDGPPDQLDELEARLEGQAYPGAIVPFNPLQMIRLIDAVDAYALANDQGDRQIRVGRRFVQIMGGRVVHETDRRQQIVRDGHELSGGIGELLDNAPVQMENAAQLQPPEPEETQSQEVDDSEDVLADARQIVGGE